MGSRLKFFSALSALLVLLLLSGWLLELLPLDPVEDASEQALDLGAGGEEARPPAPAAPTPPPAAPTLGGSASRERVAERSQAEPPGSRQTGKPAEKTERSSPPEEVIEPKAATHPVSGPPESLWPEASDAALRGRDVFKSIDGAVAWLRKHQGRDGGWGTIDGRGAYAAGALGSPGSFPAGPTALALYALLKAGQPLKDPVVKRGLDFLYKRYPQPGTSMETAMVLLAVTATAQPLEPRARGDRLGRAKLSGLYRSWATRLTRSLITMRTARGWRYNIAKRPESQQWGGPEDLVSTHLAALALFSAHRLGIKAKVRVWEEVLRYALDQQEPAELRHPDEIIPRGFAYVLGHPISDDGKATGGTTACGIATMRMALHVLTRSAAGRKRLEDPAFVLGQTAHVGFKCAMMWLDRNWSPYENPRKSAHARVLQHHWLWSLETAMDLEAATSRRLAKHAWYSEIAGELLQRQQSDGGWRVAGSWASADVLDTAFALLFLKRATRGLVTAR